MFRLYKAVCLWLECDAAAKLEIGPEPQPDGNCFAQAEHAHSFSSEPELHSGWRPSDLGWDDRSHISLRWRPKG